MLGMLDVGNVGCWESRMFGMWDMGCGMFLRMSDVGLQSA